MKMAQTVEELEKIIKEQKKEISDLNCKYKTLFNHPKVGIANIDKDGKFINVNKKFCKIIGYSKEELLSKTFKDITYIEDLKKDLDVHESSKIDGSDAFRLEKRYINKAGNIVYAEIFVKHNRDKDGEITHTTGFITDITKRKKIQDTIVDQAKTMQMYLDIVDVMILGLNENGIINLVNRKTCEVLGFEEYELIGRNWFKNYLIDDDVDEVFSYFHKIVRGEADLSEKHVNDIKCKNSIRTISWRNRVLEDNNKKFVGIISSGEDITEVLKLEEEKKRNEYALFNQSKMASMGEMLRNIAHQWRQPLSTISTAASGVKLQKELGVLSDEEFLHSMEAIVDTTQYLSQTIDDFQNFFKTDCKIKEFDSKSFLDNILNLIKPNYKQNDIKLIILQKEPYHIKGLYNELIQVIINILNNAKDAFIDRDLDNRIVQLETEYFDDAFILSISDNAGGIAENTINRIFEPYFTTKHQSLGTGIGLYMAKDIIEKNLGGKIEVYNKVLDYEGFKREGATFRLIIPNM